MKTCSVCKKEKSKIEFCKNHVSKDGLHYKCRQCSKEFSKTYYKKNTEKIKQRNINYRNNNKDIIKEKNNTYRKNNKEKLKIKTKKWKQNNKNKVEKWRKLYRDNNQNKIKDNQLLINFGITLEQYNILLKEQNNRCLICDQEETIRINKKTNKIRQLVVDHCHKTGKIRGLLCGACNKALGLFKEDSSLLLKAYNYLNGEPNNEDISNPL